MYRGIDVSQVKYARIENVCIYRRVDSTGSTIYVCIVEYMCPKLNMHVLRMYVYIDAPIILGVLYMYECMHVCMYYVCMRLCTPIGAPFGAPIANRRADRRPVCCRCVPS